MKIFLSNRRKRIARILLMVMTVQSIGPTSLFALTGGASQPEVRSFEPMGTTEMVDPFTGSFTYNIPMFELPGPNGGYPFNLAYQAGIGMDDEASWTGLGWNLNVGSINRQMRGIPDDFNGDEILTKMSIMPNVTVGASGGISFEVFGGDLSLGDVSLGVYNNNYKGAGYRINYGIGITKEMAPGMTSRMGIQGSMDSNDFPSLSPTLGLETPIGNFGLNSNFNLLEGLSNVSSNFSAPLHKDKEHKDRKSGLSSSTMLTSVHRGHVPTIHMPMRHRSFNYTLKVGGALLGLFSSGQLEGYYTISELRDNGKEVPTRAYGYINSHLASGENFIQDINRENEGPVSEDEPNLPIPVMTYDIFSITGQGIGGSFRPELRDMVVIGDADSQTTSRSISYGHDAGINHAGVNLAGYTMHSGSSRWEAQNDWVSGSGIIGGGDFEPWFLKVNGEHSSKPNSRLQAIRGESASRVNLTGRGNGLRASFQLTGDEGSPSPVSHPGTNGGEVRNQTVIPYFNGEISEDGNPTLDIFKFSFKDESGELREFLRPSEYYPGHHWAGFTVVGTDGMRYNYTLPVYNRLQEETQFSTTQVEGNLAKVGKNSDSGDPDHVFPGTDGFLKTTKIPDYAYTYLLTSVTGPDYVDVDNNGVSENDLGYWVRFTYKKTTKSGQAPTQGTGPEEHYKWRDPFVGAHLNQGFKSDPLDDRGSFVYGEKEIWYLDHAETKSHVAEFHTSERNDAKGVRYRLQDAPATYPAPGILGKPMHRLDSVNLFTKPGRKINKAVKKVKFDYGYELCEGVPNNAEGEGKLTLKKVWFEYGNSKRGRLNPYVFGYDQGFSYAYGSYDRWGNYSPIPPGQPLRNQDFPYVNQSPAAGQERNSHASAWSLNEINTPSGSRVKVAYESHDYGYVQHKQAMEMFPIHSPYGEAGAEQGASFDLDHNVLKVRVPLKEPIPAPLSPEIQKEEVMKYIDDRDGGIFFKIKTHLSNTRDDREEFVQGYLKVDMDGEFLLESPPSGDHYTHLSFELLPDEDAGEYHPLQLRVWQHLRSNQPDLALPTQKPSLTTNNNQIIEQIRGVLSLIGSVRKIFQGFYDYCDSEDFGKRVVPVESMVRLKTPTKKKFGGGVRVKQITLLDDWEHGEQGVYGQFFEYTTEEEGMMVSSGVAAYEPLIGGEENALRHAKPYNKSISVSSHNNLFFEFPVNESFFPGPQVGYAKVTQMSLAAALKAGKDLEMGHLPEGAFPSNGQRKFSTNGAVVHEFYTARDFPSIAKETEKKDISWKLNNAINLFGVITEHHLGSSQGYVYIGNDMHGKQKKITTYRQNLEGDIVEEPVSWTKYNYLSEPEVYEKERILNLKNLFNEIGDNYLIRSTGEDFSSGYSIGTDVEVVLDMRQVRDITVNGGVNFNFDFLLLGGMPSGWASVGRNHNSLKTAVFNKIIHKSGILESVEHYDGGSLVTTRNHRWDKTTGEPLLTSVNNNFDDPVFTLKYPGFHYYPGMGGIYQNLRYSFELAGIKPYPDGEGQFVIGVIGKARQLLTEGDELIIYEELGVGNQAVGRAVYLENRDGQHLFHSNDGLPDDDRKLFARIIRPGYSNQLSASVGHVTALEVPGTGDFFTRGQNFKLPRGRRLP